MQPLQPFYGVNLQMDDNNIVGTLRGGVVITKKIETAREEDEYVGPLDAGRHQQSKKGTATILY
ncbi:MAG TPA: hypothetical protein VI037_02550 [Nitrososphaera sp.]